MYKVTYLPIARKDIHDITAYIADHLQAPKAALDLLAALDKSISVLEQFPYAHRLYQPVEALEYEYRVIPVNNYIVFYVVHEDERMVEIHRVIYAKRDLEQIMKK
jgi:addiction module RelE/StbE family toxin